MKLVEKKKTGIMALTRTADGLGELRPSPRPPVFGKKVATPKSQGQTQNMFLQLSVGINRVECMMYEAGKAVAKTSGSYRFETLGILCTLYVFHSETCGPFLSLDLLV